MSTRTTGENFFSIQLAFVEKNTKVLCGQTNKQTERQTDRQTNEPKCNTLSESFSEGKNHSLSDFLAKQHKIEWHSGKRIPAPGGTVYVLFQLNPNDGLDLNQNPIHLFLSPILLIHLVLSLLIHNIL